MFEKEVQISRSSGIDMIIDKSTFHDFANIDTLCSSTSARNIQTRVTEWKESSLEMVGRLSSSFNISPGIGVKYLI